MVVQTVHMVVVMVVVGLHKVPLLVLWPPYCVRFALCVVVLLGCTGKIGLSKHVYGNNDKTYYYANE